MSIFLGIQFLRGEAQGDPLPSPSDLSFGAITVPSRPAPPSLICVEYLFHTHVNTLSGPHLLLLSFHMTLSDMPFQERIFPHKY